MDGFENESIISTLSNHRPVLITVALMGLVVGGSWAFQKQKQRQERVEQWENWYADQERQYVIDAYATCKSEVQSLRAHLSQADFGHHPFKSRSRYCSRRRSAQIVIHDVD